MEIKKNNNKWSEKKIQDYITRFLLSDGSKKYEMYNLFVFDWESDYLVITKSGYIYECEIKISRGDFFNDRKKERKHLILEGKVSDKRPHYFYYVVPNGLIDESEVPSYAGLIYVNNILTDDNNWEFAYVKKAPKIHEDKYELQDQLGLVDKFYWRMFDYKNKANNYNQLLSEYRQIEKSLYEYDVMLSERQQEIDELKKKLLLIEDTKHDDLS